MQTKDFLAKFGQTHLFYFLHKDKSDQTKRRSNVLRKDISKADLDFNQMNVEGYNIYYMPNMSSSGKRKQDDIDEFRAIWIDDDGDAAHVQDWPVEPTFIVHTSPGKRQIFWLIKDPRNVDPDDWDGVMQGLVKTYGGDPAVCDRGRVMRLPGYRNTKYDLAPKVTFEHLHRARHPWHVLKRKFPPLPYESRVHHSARGEFILADSVRALVTGESYHEPSTSLQMWLANYSVPPDEIAAFTHTLMEVSRDRVDDKRKKELDQRLKDNAQWADNAVLRVHKEREIPELTQSTRLQARAITFIPKPPEGGFKLIRDDILETMRWPNVQIATAVAFHVIGTFTGWRYCMGGTTAAGLRYILAPPGTGKSTSASYTKQAIYTIQAELNLSFDGFMGPDAYTPTPLHEHLLAFPSASVTVPESGEHGTNRAGNVSELRRYILEILVMDANQPHNMRELKDKKLGPVWGAVVNWMNESVIESQVRAWREEDAYTSGKLARADVYFAPYRTGESNKEYKTIGDGAIDLLHRIGENTINSHRTGRERMINGTHFSEVELDPLVGDKLDRLETKYGVPMEDPIEQALSGRMFQKIKRTAMIMAVADEPTNPIVRASHVDYATDLHVSLLDTLLWHIRDGELSKPFDRVMQVVRENIYKFGRGGHLDRVPSVIDLNERTVGAAWFTHFLKKDLTCVRDCLANPPFNGPQGRVNLLNKLVAEFEPEGLIKPIALSKQRTGYRLAFIKDAT